MLTGAESVPGQDRGDLTQYSDFCPIMESLGIYISDRPAAVDMACNEPELEPEPEIEPVAPPSLRGHLDIVRRDLVAGWAYDEAQPGEPVPLAVLIDGVEVARQEASLYRPDLEAAGYAAGRHGFSIAMPYVSDDRPHRIAIQRIMDGRDIGQSPSLLDPALGLGPLLEQNLARMLDTLRVEEDQERAIRLLQKQAETLQRRHQRALARLSPAPAPRLASPAPAVAGLCALIVDEVLPGLGDGPASQAILDHMQALRALDYTVKFILAQEPTPNRDAAEALAAQGIECCHRPAFEETLRSFEAAVDVVYFHRVPSVARYLPLVRQHLPDARIFVETSPRVPGRADLRLQPARCDGLHWTRLDAGWPSLGGAGPLPVEAALLRRAQKPAAAWPPPIPTYLAKPNGAVPWYP